MSSILNVVDKYMYRICWFPSALLPVLTVAFPTVFIGSLLGTGGEVLAQESMVRNSNGVNGASVNGADLNSADRGTSTIAVEPTPALTHSTDIPAFSPYSLSSDGISDDGGSDDNGFDDLKRQQGEFALTVVSQMPSLAPPMESKDIPGSPALNPGDALPSSFIAQDSSSPSPDEASESSTPAITDASTSDPDLGILRLYPGVDTVNGTDPDLGILRISPVSPERPRRRAVSVIGEASIWGGDNLLARTDPISDNTLRIGLGLRATPQIGPRTFLVGEIEGTTVRYAENGTLNYRGLETQLGVYHRLSRRAYADVRWRNRLLFTQDGGDRFLNDHQFRVSLGRTDPLTPRLKLRSAYQFQTNWADPERRNRLMNRFRLSLSQEITRDVEAGLFYNFTLADFTRRDRYDTYHQLLAQLRYNASDDVSFSVFGGGRWGNSSLSTIDFDTLLFGLQFRVNVPLF